MRRAWEEYRRRKRVARSLLTLKDESETNCPVGRWSDISLCSHPDIAMSKCIQSMEAASLLLAIAALHASCSMAVPAALVHGTWSFVTMGVDDCSVYPEYGIGHGPVLGIQRAVAAAVKVDHELVNIVSLKCHMLKRSQFLQRDSPGLLDAKLYMHSALSNSSAFQRLQMLEVGELNHQLKTGGLLPVKTVNVQTRSSRRAKTLRNPPIAAPRVLSDDGDVAFNDWADISQSVVAQSVELAGEKFQVVGYFADTTFAVIDAIRNGDSWGTALKNVGDTLVPLVSAYNPVLGFGLGVFMSVFGIGSSGFEEALNEALNELHQQIIKEVGEIITAREVYQKTLLAQEFFKKAMEKINAQPSYMLPENSTGQLSPRRDAWWADRESEFDSMALYVFAVDCLQETDPHNACRDFQEKGMIHMQVPFVLTHLNILLEQGRLADGIQQRDYEALIDRKMEEYHRLLQASYDTYLNRGFEYALSRRAEAAEDAAGACVAAAIASNPQVASNSLAVQVLKTTCELAGKAAAAAPGPLAGQPPTVVKCGFTYSKYCDGEERARCYRKEVLLRCRGDSSCLDNSPCWKCYFTLDSKAERDGNGVDIPKARFCSRRGMFIMGNRYTKTFPTVDLCTSRPWGRFYNRDSTRLISSSGYVSEPTRACLGSDFKGYWQTGERAKYESLLESLERGASRKCVAPMVLNKAQGGSCAEGALISDGQVCTAQCATGYVASHETLQCNDGSFGPARFVCEVATTTTTTNTTTATTTTTTTTTTPRPSYHCANEAQTCTCDGTVIFGKRFVSGKPGNGETATLQDILDSKLYKAEIIHGSIQCDPAGFRSLGMAYGDPAHGYYKQCYCAPSGI